MPDKPQLGTLGERTNATIALVSGNMGPATARLRPADGFRLIPGPKRFDAAEEWLARNRAQQQAVGSQQDFDRFLAGRQTFASAEMTTADRDRLFQEFLRWSQANRP